MNHAFVFRWTEELRHDGTRGEISLAYGIFFSGFWDSVQPSWR